MMEKIQMTEGTKDPTGEVISSSLPTLTRAWSPETGKLKVKALTCYMITQYPLWGEGKEMVGVKNSGSRVLPWYLFLFGAVNTRSFHPKKNDSQEGGKVRA